MPQNHSDNSAPLRLIFYTPQGVRHPNRSGFGRILRLMIEELLLSRELTWRLFLRDFRGRHRQSLLGVLWAFLMPVVTVAVFVVMGKSGVVSIPSTGFPYVLYAVIGLSVWGLFTSGISAASRALIDAGPMVVKINFPKITLVLSACLQSLVDFWIRFLLIGCVFWYYGFHPTPTGTILFLLSVIPLLLLTIGCGCLFSLVAAVVRDFGSLLGLVLTGTMLVTPILYPLGRDSFLARMNLWNPLNYLVNVPRQLLLGTAETAVEPFLVSSLVAVAVFFLGWRIFYLAQTKIAERV